MKGKTYRKIEAERGNKEELIAEGYKVEILLPWHWRITQSDYDVIVDVWPTAKKIWIVGTNKRAERYNNLFDKVKEVFNRYSP